jgi:hypothetical protein
MGLHDLLQGQLYRFTMYTSFSVLRVHSHSPVFQYFPGIPSPAQVHVVRDNTKTRSTFVWYKYGRYAKDCDVMGDYKSYARYKASRVIFVAATNSTNTRTDVYEENALKYKILSRPRGGVI